MIERYKMDIRGPYKDIRWFCPDGSFVPPGQECPDTGGVQRARYKDEVQALAESNHIFFGQILSTTDFEEFWDAPDFQSRLKQYQLGRYLQAVDNGWILRRGQYYRGAFQAEDEEAWGLDFLTWLLDKDEVLEKHYFLVRQAARDIPHRGDDNRTQRIRSVSQEISDEYPAFQDLRVKIHGQPETADIVAVKAFRENHLSRLSDDLLRKFDRLINDMEVVFAPVDLNTLQKHLRFLPRDAAVTTAINEFINDHPVNTPAPQRITSAAELLWQIRENIQSIERARARLALIDISNALEEIIFREAPEWEAVTLEGVLDKTCYLGLTSAGSGFVEKWEWDMVREHINRPGQPVVNLQDLNRQLENARRVVEWGANMVRGVYGDVVDRYGAFEPLADGFIDDRIRASVLLPFGQSVGMLSDFVAEQAGMSNHIMGLAGQNRARGLNPGYAMGELVIISGDPPGIDVASDKIYIFDRPPSDLKPVAGIATVMEGNLVSHVQLLARNLGIPNAVVTVQNLEALQQYAGQTVFYAVSNRGTVIMKPAREMSQVERRLFEVREREETRISVPVDKLQLDQRRVLNLRNVRSEDSGRRCGPKAANLGQLKAVFPERVVEGIVLPFGIFRDHLDQPMPGTEGTYWQYLNGLFEQAAAMRRAGRSEAAAEAFTLGELATFREAIRAIPLLPDFITDFRASWREAFGKPLGEVPVFLRSDTNMEDLKDFTGAGLNLTLFNVVDPEKIWQGIRDVWASPYTERSYKWRQHYLLNPENVFPSILVIPSVDVESSGVLITKGITSGAPSDLTVAFSRGAGGAVEGQAAESYLLKPNGESILLSPAREPFYRRLPASGGTSTHVATFEEPILDARNRDNLRRLAYEVQRTLPSAPGIESEGPFDVELGFKDDEIWLFQVRPFVENKRAVSSEYLESITPKMPENKVIKLNTTL